jgi:hypothetical protein
MYVRTGNLCAAIRTLAEAINASDTDVDFATAVADAWENDRVLNWLGGNVTLTEPIVLQATTHRLNFGIRGNGAKITCAFSDATKSAITVEVPVVGGAVLQGINVRNFSISNLNFRGTSPFRGGIELRCYSNGSWINSFVLSDLTCENHSEYAYRFTGSVFEWTGERLKSTGGVGGARIEARGLNGTSGEGDAGLPSAMKLIDPNFRDGSGTGIVLTNPTAFQEPFDLTVIGGYIVGNGGYGIDAPAGFTMVDNVGFESNNGGAAIVAGYRGGIVKGYTRMANSIAGATMNVPRAGMAYLVYWWGASGKLILEDCYATNEGSGTGPAKIARVDGGTVYLNRSGTQAAALETSGSPTVVLQAA